LNIGNTIYGDLLTGNIGIGSSNPNGKLSIHTTAGTVPATSGTVQVPTVLQLSGVGNQVLYVGANSVNNAMWFQNSNPGYLAAKYPISLNPNGGNVGIGTTLPTSTPGFGRVLHIADTSGDAALALESAGGKWEMGNNTPGNLQFYSSGSLRATWLSNGNLLIGTTNASPAETTNIGGIRLGQNGGSQFSKVSGPAIDLNRTGTYGALINFRWQGSIKGHIDTDGSGTTYYTSSDYRLKENVIPMTGSIDRLKALKPLRFNFISDPGRTVDGFLAHEAQEVVPEATSGTKDAMKIEGYEVTPAIEEVKDEEGKVTTVAVEAVMGEREVEAYQGIDQSKLVPLLVASLQEAVSRIETLEAQLNA
jgi:hypothetical protein